MLLMLERIGHAVGAQMSKDADVQALAQDVRPEELSDMLDEAAEEGEHGPSRRLGQDHKALTWRCSRPDSQSSRLQRGSLAPAAGSRRAPGRTGRRGGGQSGDDVPDGSDRANARALFGSERRTGWRASRTRRRSCGDTRAHALAAVGSRMNAMSAG